MTYQEKTSLLTMIKNGNIQEAIDRILSIEMNENSKNEALTISSRYRILKQQSRLGVLSAEQENINENQIITSLIGLINSLNDQPYPKETLSSVHFTKSHTLRYILASVGIIVILGILNFANIFPPKGMNEKLQLTVFVTDTKGNVVLENEGRLNIPLGNRSLNEAIGTNGRTNFPDITANNKGDTIQIGLAAEGWEIADNNNTFIFTGDPIRLKVKKDNSLGIIKGVVKSRDGQQFIDGASILINTDTTLLTNASGLFKIILPENMCVKKESESYLLTISKKGYKTKTQYHYPKSSDAEIRLEKQ